MSLIIDIELKDYELNEVALSYGFYYGSYLTTDNLFLREMHRQIVDHMDEELAKLLGKHELVEMKATIIDDLEKKRLINDEIARRTKKLIQKLTNG